MPSADKLAWGTTKSNKMVNTPEGIGNKSTLVSQSAYARALIERGEDGGTASSEAYALFRGMLSDAIALESTRYPEDNFVAV